MSNKTTNPVVKWVLIAIVGIIFLGVVVFVLTAIHPDDYQTTKQLRTRGYIVAYERRDDTIWQRGVTIFGDGQSITPDDSRLFCQLPYLRNLSFVRGDMSGLNLDEIGNCPELFSVDFTYVTRFPAGEIGKLAATSVKCAFLQNVDLKDSDLEVFAKLTTLEVLHLENNAGITDAGFEYLEKITSLRCLDLTGTSVTEDGVEEFRKKRPDVTVYF